MGSGIFPPWNDVGVVTWSTRAFFPPSLWSSLFVAASSSAMTSLRSLSESSSLPDRSSTREASNRLSRSLSSRALRSVSSSLNNNGKKETTNSKEVWKWNTYNVVHLDRYEYYEHIYYIQVIYYEKNHKMKLFHTDKT